jgi:Flp pilus assembly protein CpaB
LKRSNRLILLVGVVLAAVAFVAIVFLFSSPSSGGTGNQPITELDTVTAAVNIPLGTQVQSDMLQTHKVVIANRLPGVIGDPSQIVGQIVRTNVTANAQMTDTMFATGNPGAQPPGPLLPKGLRAQSVQVDQVSGVGTLINVGDRVDAVVGLVGQGTGDGGTAQCGTPFPFLTVDSQTDTVTSLDNPGSTLSVKMLLQNMQVVGAQLPPIDQTVSTASPAPGSGGTTLNGQKEIVILAVTAQQSEVIKYAQIDGCISLVLRSPKDYVDDAGNPTEPLPDGTTGIILKSLVDEYGVLPPQIVEAILPK